MSLPRVQDPRYDGALSVLGLYLRTRPGAPAGQSMVVYAGEGAPTDVLGRPGMYFRLDPDDDNTIVYLTQGSAWQGIPLSAGADAIADTGTYYTTDTIDAAFDALALQIGGDSDAAYNFTEANVLTDDDAVYAALDKLDVRAGITARDLGSVASFALLVLNQPSDTDTVTVGADVYEFVDAGVDAEVSTDTNIAVMIATSVAGTRTNLIAAVNAVTAGNEHATALLADGVTPALANGTENFLADEVGTTVRLRSADAPGGSVVAADPSVVLAEAITDAADVWSVGAVNVNTLAGVAPGMHQEARTAVAVTAAMIANTLALEFPFTVGGFLVQIRTSTGVLRGTTGTDTFVASGTAITVTFGGGAAPDIQATDVITIHAWSAPA